MAFWGDDICSTVVNYEYKCIWLVYISISCVYICS
jgi:hypothetical protein